MTGLDGPWTLIEADVVRGHRFTSWPSLWTDLRFAGAEAVDEELVIDGQFTSSRSPADLPALASGPESTRAVLAPVFGAIGSRTLWLGEAGAGRRLKLVLNTWLAFLMEGIAESVALADTIGVDHQALRDALQGSPVNAPVALLKLAKIDAGDESPDFSLRWATKDLDLALAEAGDQTLPVAAAIDHRWHTLVEAGLGQADVSAVRQGLARPR
jgi:3-hydroxyisobutyrate dehydrogenase